MPDINSPSIRRIFIYIYINIENHSHHIYQFYFTNWFIDDISDGWAGNYYIPAKGVVLLPGGKFTAGMATFSGGSEKFLLRDLSSSINIYLHANFAFGPKKDKYNINKVSPQEYHLSKKRLID